MSLTTSEVSAWYMVKDKTTIEAPLGLFSSTNTNKEHGTAWMELERVIRRYYDSDGGNNRSDNNPNQPTDGARRKKPQPEDNNTKAGVLA